MSNAKNVNPKQKQEVKIADNIPGAEYANAMQVNHNSDEFQVVFLNVMGGSGKVASKIITTPGHFKRMINAMKDNLDKYEKQFGAVSEPGKMDGGIGFKS